MKKKKKILIITSNDYLAYQPTILNLYDHLESYMDVTIVSFEPEFIGKQKTDGREILYLQVPRLLNWCVQKFDYALQLFFKALRPVFSSLSHNFLYSTKLQLYYLQIQLAKMKADEYVAVDIPVLYHTQKVFGKCHFLSLEIRSQDPYLGKIKTENIMSVLIQNKERYNFLFPIKKPHVFFIQNAPVFREDMITHYERQNLIWAGSILRRFAVLECIKFIENYPEYKLVLRGGAEPKTLSIIQQTFQFLLSSRNIIIDNEYLALEDFVDYLSHYKIGFCFYSWELIKENFNYQSAPSGKLFMYLAAGVPVIACNIPGFQFVHDFRAGILINDYKPETIHEALKIIEADYEKFQQACYEVARYFSFDKMVKPFQEFIMNDNLG